VANRGNRELLDLQERRIVVCAQDPDGPQFPDMERVFECYLDEHPLISQYRRTGEARARKVSDLLTLRQFRALPIYQEFYRRLNVRYLLGMALAIEAPFVVWIELDRGRDDFSERDRHMFNLLRPHLMQTLRNAIAVSVMEHIFKKLGVDSRTAAAARALALSSPSTP